MGKIISFSIQKGGTAKTSTCKAVADILGSKNYKVLCVDMDAQGNLTDLSDYKKEPEYTIFDALKDSSFTTRAIVSCKYHDILVGNIGLYQYDEVETSYRELRDCLYRVKNRYDYILVDAPPSLGHLQRACLFASDYTILPVQADAHAQKAIERFYETISDVKRQNKGLIVLGIVLTRYNQRLNARKYYKNELEEVAKTIGTNLFDTVIRDGISVVESQGLRQPLIDYAPNSNPAKDYERLAEEILERIGG